MCFTSTCKMARKLQFYARSIIFKIQKSFSTNDNRYEMMCRAQNSGHFLRGQGHT